jgi:type I restriction enzyme S subunit
MREQKKQILLPKLRFPEFREAGEWEEKKLREVCNINPSNEGLPESFVYIDLESVVDGRLTCKKRINRDSAPSRAQRLLTNGDVIYQIVRPYQRNNLFCNFDDQQSYVASTGYAQLRSRGSSNYLYQLIHTDTFVNKVVAKCTGSNYPAINSSDLAEIEVVAPNAQEQQKIADCLTSIDELITLEVQKLDTLKAHKKGLMQQLFPAEGETLPKLRFPEFRDAGEWEEKCLGDVASLQRGFDLPSDQIKPGTIPVVYSNGIQNLHDVGMAEGPGLVTGRSGTIGKLHFIEDGYYWPHNTSLWVTSFHGNFPKFVYYLYTSIGMGRFASGSGVPTLNRNDVHAFKACVPPSPSEQQKIADCLTSLDELITAQTQKLAALKAHKKGLMQQLFPSVGGVDGEAGRGGRPVMDETQG